MLVNRVVQLVNQHQLQNENGEHEIELRGGLKASILKNISEDDNLVQQDELS